jgi:hypothetical protein
MNDTNDTAKENPKLNCDPMFSGPAVAIKISTSAKIDNSPTESQNNVRCSSASRASRAPRKAKHSPIVGEIAVAHGSWTPYRTVGTAARSSRAIAIRDATRPSRVVLGLRLVVGRTGDHHTGRAHDDAIVPYVVAYR